MFIEPDANSIHIFLSRGCFQYNPHAQKKEKLFTYLVESADVDPAAEADVLRV